MRKTFTTYLCTRYTSCRAGIAESLSESYEGLLSLQKSAHFNPIMLEVTKK